MTSHEQDPYHISRRNLLKSTAVAGTIAAASLGGIALSSHLSTSQTAETAHAQTASGVVREYWIQADSFFHNLVPTGHDRMMGMHFTASQSSYWAIGYRAYTPNWGSPLPGDSNIGPNTGIPGPIIRAQVGDTILVHFRNNDTHYGFPHSIHPHGVRYTPPNDGAWTAFDPNKPGTAVAFGQSYDYQWNAISSSVGTWPYHDHSLPQNNLMEYNVELGLFGMFAITDSSTPTVDQEICLVIHDLYQSDVSSLSQDFDCFNGYAYMGNTPTFNVAMNSHVRWRIVAYGKEFHAFHLHGHRWIFNNRFDDTLILGPATTVTFDYIEDNPGKWLYHCHVTDHMMGGMVGMYISA